MKKFNENDNHQYVLEVDNKIVGFSGSTFLEEQKNESKYINSKETIIYKKSQIKRDITPFLILLTYL